MASKLLGAVDAQRQLRALGEVAEAKIVKGAVRAAIKIPVNLAKFYIPRGDEPHRTYKGRLVAPGFSARSIQSRVVVSKQTKNVVGVIGVEREAFYAVSFVDRGTSRMAARPWLRNAFTGTAGAQSDAFGAYIQKRISAIAAKAGRGAAG